MGFEIVGSYINDYLRNKKANRDLISFLNTYKIPIYLIGYLKMHLYRKLIYVIISIYKI